MDLIGSLIKYFEGTPEDVLAKDRAECEHLNNIGPYVEDMSKENLFRFEFLKFNEPVLISPQYKEYTWFDYAVGICHCYFDDYNEIIAVDKKHGFPYSVFPGDLEETAKIAIQEKIDKGEYEKCPKCSWVMIRDMAEDIYKAMQ